MPQRSETPLNHHQEQRLLFWLWSWSMASGSCWSWSLAMGGVLLWFHFKHWEVCRLKINYTNTTLYQSVPHKYTTHNSYDEGKHLPHIESLAMTYWIYVAQTCFLFTNKPTLHRKLFALIKTLCFFRQKEGCGSHDSRQQQKQRVLSCRETKAPWVTEIKGTSIRHSKIKQYNSLYSLLQQKKR